MTTPLERITAKGQLVPLLFSEDAVADAQTDAVMAILETADATTTSKNGASEYKIPWRGDVVGISILSDSARTAGTLTVDATVNGTKTSLTAVLNATDTTHAAKSQARGADAFAKGDRIGCKLTTASWTPVAADVVVVVWVLVYLEDEVEGRL